MAIPSPYDIAMRRLRENAKQTGIYQGLVKPFVDLSDAMEDPSAYVVQDPESTQYGRLNSAGMGMAGGLANAGMMGAGVQSGPGLGMGARVPGGGMSGGVRRIRLPDGTVTEVPVGSVVPRSPYTVGESTVNPLAEQVAALDRNQFTRLNNPVPPPPSQPARWSISPDAPQQSVVPDLPRPNAPEAPGTFGVRSAPELPPTAIPPQPIPASARRGIPAAEPPPAPREVDFDSLRRGWEWGPEAAAGRTLDDANLNSAFRDLGRGTTSRTGGMVASPYEAAKAVASEAAGAVARSPLTKPALTAALLTAGGGLGMSLADRAMEGHARESAKRAGAQQKPADGVQSPWPEYGPPMSAMGQMPSKGKPGAGAGAGGFSTGLAGSGSSAQPVGGMAGAQGAPADGGPDARRVGPDHYEVIQRSQDMGDEYARVFAHVKREARKQAFASAQGGGPNFSVMRDPAYNRVYLLTAGGDEFEFDLGKPSDQQEFARMARHTGMSPDQLMAAAEMAGRPLYDVYSPMRSPESMQTAGRFDPRQILANPPQDPNVAKAMLDRMF